MPVTAQDTSVRGPVGAVWPITVCVTGGVPYAASTVAPILTVTDPDGLESTPAMTGTVGAFCAEVTLDVPGRWVAAVVADGFGAVTLTAYASEIVDAGGMPDLAACRAYLGVASQTDAQIEDALAAEASAQRDVCRVPADYPASLREALLRRVQRNLAMHKLPIAVLAGDADGGSATLLPRFDPEVRRLEAPYRRLAFGASRRRTWGWS